MDQIRSTMMQQEALFKEQVQALHKLYGVQRSAMQEIRKRTYAHPQVLVNDQLQGPVLEGKALRQVHASGHSHKEERLSLSLHPFCTSEELRAHDSQTSHGGQSKFVRDFDLEKIPEDCMDESETQTELNSFNPDPTSADKKQMLSNQGSKFTVSSESSRSIISTAHKKPEEAPLKDYVNGFWFTKTNSHSVKQSLQSGTLISEIDNQDENSGGGSNGRDDALRPSFSSTVSDPDMKVTESESCSNSKTNMVSVDESNENIAAEILLSFVSRSEVSPEGSKGENEDMGIDKKLNMFDESVKWTRSISRRRTLRRAR